MYLPFWWLGAAVSAIVSRDLMQTCSVCPLEIMELHPNLLTNQLIWFSWIKAAKKIGQKTKYIDGAQWLV